MNKILRLTFVAVLAAMSSLSFAQKTVTFSATQDHGTKEAITKDGITIAITKGTLDNKYAYRIYKGSTLTVSSAKEDIVKIVMICDDYSGGAYLADGFKTGNGLTISSDKKTATWEGNTKKVEFTTPIHQVRVKSFTITLKDVPSGIEEISNGSLNGEAPIYNLAGQRVSKEYKGAVIQNGKKFIKK